MLNGNGGADYIKGAGGADTLDGGDGVDTASYYGSAAGVTVGMSGTGSGGDAEGDVLSHFENLVGSDYNDTLMGNGDANTLSGMGGDDILKGGGGADTLAGSYGNDQLKGGGAADALDGGDGIDVAIYSNSDVGVNVSLVSGLGFNGTAAGDTLTGIENLSGSNYGDTLTGNGLANVLTGGQGADSLIGNDGNDTFRYVDGADAVAGESVNGGTGTDKLLLEGTGAISFAGVTITSVEQLEFGAGTSVATFSGTQMAAFSTVTGGAGANGLVVNASNVNLSGITFNSWTNGVDTITINGTAAGNVLTGSNEQDRIIGGGGNDTLTGGVGTEMPAPGFNGYSVWTYGVRPTDQFGDFNGDGRDDLVQLHENGNAYVFTSNGAGFNPYAIWTSGVRPTDKVADFNGDGRNDLIQLHQNGNAYVWTSNGNGFNAYTVWGSGVRPADKIGDFNGDGRADLIQLHVAG